MADDGGQQRKLDFRTAVEDVKAIASVFSMEAESVLGRRTARLLLWTSAIVAVLTISILIGYPYGITLWDWIKLLVVPAVLAAGGVWFNQQQQARQQETQDQRSQDEALQAYLDQLTQLLVTQHDEQLTRMRVDDDVRQVIQARSEPLLRSLDPTRRFSLILFLAVMGLLAKASPLISLAGADLRNIDGRGAPLQAVDLQGADLSGAALNGADLAASNLGSANLSGARLDSAKLSGANLRGADLGGANLAGADLLEADLSGANLAGAHLEGADLRETRSLLPDQLDEAVIDEDTTVLVDYLRTDVDLPSGSSYHVKRGDTLWKIADKKYNNGNEWPRIHRANNWILDPNRIQAGWWIWIPRR